MDVVETLASNGVPTDFEAGTPSPLPEGLTEDGLDAIELEPVLEVVAGHAAGPLGAARVRARRPTLDLAWIRLELARVGEVAALFRRGDGLLAEPVPDVAVALSRLRIEGSVLEGRDLVAIQRVLGSARRVHADLRRVQEAAPLTAELAHDSADKALERRLEQSLDADGSLLDTASPGLAAARREVQQAQRGRAVGHVPHELVARLDAFVRGIDEHDLAHDAPQGSRPPAACRR